MKLLTVFLIANLLFSCQKSSDNNATNINLTGTWKVAFFWDQKDETSNFTAYTFLFNSAGELQANTGTTTIKGTWSETSSRFNINFGTHPLLSDLNGNWLKIEKTDTTIKLKEDNPAQDDQLHFIKN